MNRKNFVAMLLGAIPLFQMLKNIFNPKVLWGESWGIKYIETENVMSVKDIERAVMELEKCSVPDQAYFIIYQGGKPIAYHPTSISSEGVEKYLCAVNFSET